MSGSLVFSYGSSLLHFLKLPADLFLLLLQGVYNPRLTNPVFLHCLSVIHDNESKIRTLKKTKKTQYPLKTHLKWVISQS